MSAKSGEAAGKMQNFKVTRERVSLAETAAAAELNWTHATLIARGIDELFSVQKCKRVVCFRECLVFVSCKSILEPVNAGNNGDKKY